MVYSWCEALLVVPLKRQFCGLSSLTKFEQILKNLNPNYKWKTNLVPLSSYIRSRSRTTELAAAPTLRNGIKMIDK